MTGLTALRPYYLGRDEKGRPVVEMREYPICRCIGMAQWDKLAKRYSPGRRGPNGGVCGACGGAIPENGN